MATKIQLRRDTAANFTSENPTLAQGEPAYERDTGFMKVGDGTTAWTSLPYLSKFDSISVDTINELTSGNGVEIDGVELKDGGGYFTTTIGVGASPISGLAFYGKSNGGIRLDDNGTTNGVQLQPANAGGFSFYNTVAGVVQNTPFSVDSSGNTNFSGNVKPGTDDTYDLGTLSLRWDDVYATNGTIQTSDERDKDRILDIPDSLSIIDSLRPVSFKWKDYTQTIEKTKLVPVEKTRTVKKDGKQIEETYTEQVEEKYTEEVEKTFKRTHYGLIAQEVEQSIIENGINPEDFAPLIYNKETDKYGLRYVEFIPILIGSIQQLKQKVEELEIEVEKLKS